MATIQAYLDDSGIGQVPASVTGGFVSTSERWAAFSLEWQQALDTRPCISYFKMKEANALRGEFKGWSATRRDERIAVLFSIIERHAMFGVSSAIHHEMYRAIFREKLTKPVANLEYPYFILFHGVVTCIAQHLAKSSHDPIDFIFDTQPDQMKKMLEGWELFVSVSGDAHRALIRNPPTFRDDKRALPLQAADLHAWWVRKMCESYLRARPERKPPFPENKESLNLPIVTMFWKQDALQRMYASLSGSIPIALRPLKK